MKKYESEKNKHEVDVLANYLDDTQMNETDTGSAIIKPVVDVLAKSLDDTQKNATDTESVVKQVLSMSGKELHDKTVTAILDDKDTDLSEKIALIDSENEKFDCRQDNSTERVIRLQTAKTDNVGTATSWWSRNWGWVLGGGCVLIVGVAAATPGGRRIAAKAWNAIAA